MNPTYKLRILAPFMDAEKHTTVPCGSIFETTDLPRTMKIIKLGLGELIEISHQKTGPRVMFHQKFCYKIGGIESANLQIARAFPDKNIVFVFNIPNLTHMLELGKTCDVIWDDGSQRYQTDVLILTNYDSAPSIIDRVEARKVYQQVHADWENMKKMDIWHNFTWQPHERVDKVLAVSETAQKGLKHTMGVDSVVVPNILKPVENSERPLVFMVMSRASAEKGIDRVIDLINKMDEAGKDFVVYICSTVDGLARDQLVENRHVVLVQPHIANRALLRSADYLIQLSLNESYCYSVREALEAQVPCIVSRIPEFEKLIKEGKNGYFIGATADKTDVEKIFNKIPRPEPYHEKIPGIWQKVLGGKL